MTDWRRAGVACAGLLLLAEGAGATPALAARVTERAGNAPPAYSATSSSLLTPEHQIVFGAESSTSSDLQAHEAVAGRQLTAVRIYRLWGQQLYENVAPEAAGSDEMQMVQSPADRLLFVSVRAKSPDGTLIPFSSIASASPSSTGAELTLYDNIVAMAQQIEQFVSICTSGGSFPGSSQVWPANGTGDPGCEVYFTFNGEPESAADQPNGTGAQFIAAWQNIWNIFKSEGVCSVSDPEPAASCLAPGGALIKYVWVVTAWGFQRTDQFNVANYYPGDSYVDIVASDAYNWYTCHQNSWQSMAYEIASMRQWGLQHPTEPLVVTEWNSVEDPSQLGSRKAAWISATEQLFEQPGYQQFWGVLNWGESTSDGPCDFGYDSSPQAAAAWAQMGADPSYQGTTIPILLQFVISGSMVAGTSTPVWSASATLPTGVTYPGSLPSLSCELVNPAGGPDLPISASLAPGTYQVDPATCTSGEPQVDGGTDPNYAVADYGGGDFTVTPPNGPQVTIVAPAPNTTISGTTVVSGTTTDTDDVSSVQVSIDNGAAETADGTTEWSLPIDTTLLSNGLHSISVTAVDVNGDVGTAQESVTVSNVAATSCPPTTPGDVELSGNVSVETNQAGWTGHYNSESVVTRVQPATGSYDGLWALSVQAKSGTSGVAGLNNVSPDWVPSTTAGTPYTATVEVAGSAPGEHVTVTLRETTSSGSGVGYANASTTLTDTNWHAISDTFTAHNSGDVLHYSVYVSNLPNSTQALLADCLMLQAPQPSTSAGTTSPALWVPGGGSGDSPRRR